MVKERPKILVVDDQPENIDLIKHYFLNLPYKIYSAANGVQAMQLVSENPPDLIILDVVMPEMDGFEVCRRLKTNPRTRLIPIIMVTSLDKSRNKIQGIKAGVDDFLTKPIDFIELKTRVASLLRVKRFTDELENAEKIIFSLALAVEAKDKYTMNHCRRIAKFGAILGDRLGLKNDIIRTIRRGAYLHDIGKIAISDKILLKKGPLEKHEFEIIKRHPIIGVQICNPLNTLKTTLPIIKHHHERYNGTGYPDGLAKLEIPLTAQIVAIVDSFDALTSNRPYRKALSKSEAITQLKHETEKGLWNRDLTEIFLEIIDNQSIIEEKKAEFTTH